MADESRGNVERLRQAGIVKADPLPPAYAEILEELEPDEVDRIIDLLTRLVEAEKQYGSGAQGQAWSLVQCFVPL